MQYLRLCLCVGMSVCLAMAGCGKKSTGQAVPPECGNEKLEVGEECDASDLGGSTCDSLGLEGGTLACTGLCRFDVTGCAGTSECGNGEREYPEECDGGDLAGGTCESVGFAGGELGCTATCSFDTSSCDQTPICGDQIVIPPEQCDGFNLGGESCESLGLGSGELDCEDDCAFDVSGCSGTAVCPNGSREFPEECDGADLAGQSCVSLGFGGGTLECDLGCTFDTSGCTAPPVCGNSAIDGTEDCDGTDLGGQSCLSLGFEGGTLSCENDCTFDTSECTAGPVCGNSVAEGTEDCDGADVSGQSCVSLGYGGGTLGCETDCTFDTSGCTPDTTPTCSPVPSPVQREEGAGPLVLAFACTDLDGDMLSIGGTDASAAPGGGISFGNDGPAAVLTVTITLDPDSNDAGPTGTATFDVSFSVTDPGANTVTVVQRVTFDNLQPVADAGPDQLAAPGGTVTLSGTGSQDPDGDPLAFLWTPGPGSPPLDDPSSPTPVLIGGACNETYVYTLVVNDGVIDSAPDSVTVTVVGVGPYVSEQDCFPNDECGDLTRPWCTIQGGVEAARANAFPRVFVKQGTYVQGNLAAAVPETLVIDPSPTGDPDILGGYTDLATLTRAAGPSCDPSVPGSGATLVQVNTAAGIQLNAGATNLIEMFCVRSVPSMLPAVRKANVTITDAEPVIRLNLIDAVSGSLATTTVGIDIVNSDSAIPFEVTIDQNTDNLPAGMVFGGDGDNAIGISATGSVDLKMSENTINGGAGSTTSSGVYFEGHGSVIAGNNAINGGDGSSASNGIVALATGGVLTVSLTENDVVGGSSPGSSTGVSMSGTTSVAVDWRNQIEGRPSAAGLQAVGLRLDDAGEVLVSTDNTIKGGVARNQAYGLWATGSTDLEVSGRNRVRGGRDSGADQVTLVGIFADGASSLTVGNLNVISGSDVDPLSGLLFNGGRIANGIVTNGVPQIEVTDNQQILGGAPRYIASIPILQVYSAYGLLIQRPDQLLVDGNALIQGCSPYCGPGDEPASAGLPPSTGAGVVVSASSGAGSKVIEGNTTILGGPVRWLGPGVSNARTRSVGVDVLGPQNAGSGPIVTVQGNVTVAGNVEPDTLASINRPQYASGMRVFHSIVTAQQNTLVEGGRAEITAIGIEVLQQLAIPTGLTAARNGRIVGNPFEDASARDPFGVYGIRFHALGGSVSSMRAAGALGALQDIGGGYARSNAQGQAVGIDIRQLETFQVDHVRAWGGVVRGGLVQRGISMVNVVADCSVANSLIEACGLADTAGLHHPGCESLFARSEGLYALDSSGAPSLVFNNLIFGGFSTSGSTGARIDDGGNASAQIKLYNNYLNAQGALPSAMICGPGAMDARAIELASAPGGVMMGGAGLGFHNNIIDAGGRACYRYGVYERSTGVAVDLFTAVKFTNNVWVQRNAARDVNPPGSETWGYREANGAGILWCRAGAGPAEVIAPGGCLNDAPGVPTSDADYSDNREGDPEFEGDDTQMSERPGTLPLGDFHALAAVLQGNGSLAVLPAPLTEDYEGDPRAGLVCDVGHDETP